MEESNNIKDVRAWLYEVMAQLEKAHDVDATKKQASDGTITIELKIKY